MYHIFLSYLKRNMIFEKKMSLRTVSFQSLALYPISGFECPRNWQLFTIFDPVGHLGSVMKVQFLV